MAALDYLVKPFDDERFEQAFRRARWMIELEERLNPAHFFRSRREELEARLGLNR